MTDELTEIFEEGGNADATFTMASGGTATVPGVFEDIFEEQLEGARFGVESKKYVFSCSAAGLSKPDGTLLVVERDTVVVRKRTPTHPVINCVVRDPRPDSEGGVSFTLEEA